MSIIPYLLLFFSIQTIIADDNPTPLTGRFINDPLFREKAMELPEVQKAFSQCENENKQNLDPTQRYKNVSECFDKEFAKLPPQQSKLLLEKLKNYSPDDADHIKFQQSSAYQRLTEYLYKNLEKDLFGANEDEPNKHRKIVDHDVYYKMMDSFFGKSLIFYMSSFCIDTNPYNKFIIPENEQQRKDQRVKNIKSLSQKLDKETAGSKNFTNCLQLIEHICGKTKFDNNYDYTNMSDSDFIYTNQRACATSRQLKSIRQKMIASKKLEKEMQKHASKNQAQAINLGMEHYNYGNGANEKSIDEITSPSSGEMLDKSDVGVAVTQEAMKFKAMCAEGGANPECLKKVISNNDYNATLQGLKEYKAKASIMSQRIGSMNQEEIKKHLIEQEGWTQQQVQLTLAQAANEGGFEKLRQNMAERYKAETNAIIQQRLKRLENSAPQMKVNSQGKPDAQASKKAWSELGQRKMDEVIQLAQLAAYDNLVKASLTVVDPKTGRSTTNKIPAERERLSSALNPIFMQKLESLTQNQSNTPNSNKISSQDFQALQASTQELIAKGGSENKSSKATTTMEVETLNRFVLKNYLNEPPKAQKQPQQGQEIINK